MNPTYAKRQLIQILQAAFSGELAAALAYQAHSKTLKVLEQKNQVKQIEQDEWVHRANILKMLNYLEASPLKRKEFKAWFIGKVLGSFCFLMGWFLPMYLAGWLEAQNVHQYKIAAGYARFLQLQQFEKELLQMQALEQEHEDFFLALAQSHPWFHVVNKIFKWT